MKTQIALVSLCAALCVALVLALTRTNYAATNNQGETAQPVKGDGGKDKSEDEVALQKAVAAYSVAFAKGDVAAVVSMWTPDAEFIDDDGKTYRGRDTLTKIFTKSLPSFKGYKITSKLTSVRFVKPDVALVDGEQTFTPPRGEPDVSRFTSVWTKTDGQWRIRSARDLTAELPGENVAGRQLRELDWMLGEWVSGSDDAKVHLKVSWTLNKSYMIWEYEVKRKDASSKVVQWLGWDPLREQIKTWVFDDQGGFGDAYWVRNGNTWTSDAVGVLPDGATGSSVNVLRYQDDNTFLWQSVRREFDEQPLPDVEAKFTRPASSK